MAVTFFACVNATVQAPVPEHAPLQPANAEFLAGVAPKVTTVPALKAALHVVAQSIPAGLDFTVPKPVPASVTVSATLCSANVAVTVCNWLMPTVQDPAPLQAPLQPASTLLGSYSAQMGPHGVMTSQLGTLALVFGLIAVVVGIAGGLGGRSTGSTVAAILLGIVALSYPILNSLHLIERYAPNPIGFLR